MPRTRALSEGGQNRVEACVFGGCDRSSLNSAPVRLHRDARAAKEEGPRGKMRPARSDSTTTHAIFGAFDYFRERCVQGVCKNEQYFESSDRIGELYVRDGIRMNLGAKSEADLRQLFTSAPRPDLAAECLDEFFGGHADSIYLIGSSIGECAMRNSQLIVNFGLFRPIIHNVL